MPKDEIKLFTVEGTGSFPYDMLRFDACWPHTGEDSAKLDYFVGVQPRRVCLASYSMPTAARWSSFLWRFIGFGDWTKDTTVAKPRGRKTFRGEGSGDDYGVVYVRRGDTDRESTLSLRLDLANHSPTGFAWGYGGSGPAQLALAILVEVVGPERTMGLYHKFKDDVVARMPQRQPWTLTEEEILEWIDRQKVTS